MYAWDSPYALNDAHRGIETCFLLYQCINTLKQKIKNKYPSSFIFIAAKQTQNLPC
jgi:hypothetical protein